MTVRKKGPQRSLTATRFAEDDPQGVALIFRNSRIVYDVLLVRRSEAALSTKNRLLDEKPDRLLAHPPIHRRISVMNAITTSTIPFPHIREAPFRRLGVTPKPEAATPHRVRFSAFSISSSISIDSLTCLWKYRRIRASTSRISGSRTE